LKESIFRSTEFYVLRPLGFRVLVGGGFGGCSGGRSGLGAGGGGEGAPLFGLGGFLGYGESCSVKGYT